MRRVYATIHAAIWVAYLSPSWLRQRLGTRWRIIALGIGVLGPLVVQIILNISGFKPPTGSLDGFAFSVIYLLFMWLFVILNVSWLYRPWVIVLTAMASGLSILLLGFLFPDADISLIEESGSIALLATVTLGMVGYNFWRFSQRLQSRWHQLEEANHQLRQQAILQEELTISRERNRLARELHDTLAHSLSGVTVQIEAARSLWHGNPKRAEIMLARADEMARTGLTEARRALQALRATPLQDLGLGLALEMIGEEAAERAGATLKADLDTHVGINLKPHVEQGLYRIAQEALENIVRHARATTITLRLAETAEKLCLEVADDGIGFKIDKTFPEVGHYGLRGMYERAVLCGADLQAESTLGQGTRICISIRKTP